MLRFVILAAVAASLAATGCTRTPKRCDDQRLEAVVTAMEGGSGRPAPEEYATFAMEGLQRACPSIPGKLVRRLQCTFGSDSTDPSCLDVFADDATEALASEICKDERAALDHLTHDAYPEREAAYFDACGLRRFGLLDKGEEYWYQERFVWVALRQMIDRKADPLLAKRFARALLHVGAPADVLDDRCARVTMLECSALAEAYGVHLPHASRIGTLPRPVNVMVGREHIELHGKTITSLKKEDVNQVGVAVFADVAARMDKVIELVDSAERLGADTVGLVTSWTSRDVGVVPCVTKESHRGGLRLMLASDLIHVRRDGEWEQGPDLGDLAGMTALMKGLGNPESLTLDVPARSMAGDAAAAVTQLDEARCAAKGQPADYRCGFAQVRFRVAGPDPF